MKVRPGLFGGGATTTLGSRRVLVVEEGGAARMPRRAAPRPEEIGLGRRWWTWVVACFG